MKSYDINDITVLVVDGMLTLGSEQLAAAFKDLLARDRLKVILDLMKVKYIDSLGVGTIAGGHTSLEEAGGKLVLARTNEKIHELLRLTGLQNHIETFATVEEAVNKFDETD